MSRRRVEKVAEAIKQEISKIILYELKDPRISFVTVTKAELSMDLRTAKVYISVLGDEASQKKTLQTLLHAKGYIQALIGERLNIRYTPVLNFYIDESIKKGLQLSKLIEEAVKEPAEEKK